MPSRVRSTRARSSVLAEFDEGPASGPEAAAPSEARAEPVDAPRSIEIPERRYFRIGEVGELLGVRPHVLRYWETEFRDVRPTKARNGQRVYRRRDVEILVAVRRLLYEERYTIAGARDRLKEILAARQLQLFTAPRVTAVAGDARRLELVRDGVRGLLELIDRREGDLGGSSPEGRD